MPDNITIKKVFNKKKIQAQAENMIKEVRQSNDGTGPLIAFKEYYQDKYSYLYENFPLLFDMVYEDPDNHDCLEILKKILACADLYHNSHASYDNTSRAAGQILFDKFYTEKKKK
jgi:hypothetical protein